MQLDFFLYLEQSLGCLTIFQSHYFAELRVDELSGPHGLHVKRGYCLFRYVAHQNSPCKRQTIIMCHSQQ